MTLHQMETCCLMVENLQKLLFEIFSGFQKTLWTYLISPIFVKQVENQEKSIGVPVSKAENLDIAAVRDADARAAKRASAISFPEAQRLVSLFFALCTKVCHLHFY